MYEISAAQYRGEGPESAWRATVKDAATLYGWVVLFELPDKLYAELSKLSLERRNGKWVRVSKPGLIAVYAAISGLPDLVLGHMIKGVSIAVELKIPGKDARENQRARLAQFDASGTDAYVWQTGDEQAFAVLANPFLPGRRFWNGTYADDEGNR